MKALLNRRTIVWTLAALCLLAIIWVGVFFVVEHRWPFSAQHKASSPIVQSIVQQNNPPNSGATYGDFDRLTNFPGKLAIPCPAQTARTMVLLLIGQSNTGNHAEMRYISEYGDKVLNSFGGKCFLAASPLLGTTGEGGESWTLLGNKLIAAGLADRVVLIPAGIGATSIQRWQQGGDLNDMLLAVLDEVRTHYRITHVLWHQGETDFFNKTSKSNYTAMFSSLVDSLRQHGVEAPIFPSVATRCVKGPAWFPDSPTAQAQQALPDKARNIFRGVDTDTLLTLADREDTCHYKKSGQEKFANAWLEVLRAHSSAGIAH